MEILKYLHIKDLEEHNPGYKDRSLIWCKVHFKMINADPIFEMLDEIDRWRYLAFVMLELQLKKPVPLDEKYLTKKGFNFEDRPMSLTLEMLHNLIGVVTEDSEVRAKSRVEYSRIDKSRVGGVTIVHKEVNLDLPMAFDEFSRQYKKMEGRTEARVIFLETIKTQEKWDMLLNCLKNYQKTKNFKKEMILNMDNFLTRHKDYETPEKAIKPAYEAPPTIHQIQQKCKECNKHFATEELQKDCPDCQRKKNSKMMQEYIKTKVIPQEKL